MKQNLGSSYGPLAVRFASKSDLRSIATSFRVWRGRQQPIGSLLSTSTVHGAQSHPWKICKSKLLTTGRAEADLNMRGYKMSWSSGWWGTELCLDPGGWHAGRGLHFVAFQKPSFPRAASLEEIGSSCFVQLFLHNVCIVGEHVKACVSMKNLSFA